MSLSIELDGRALCPTSSAGVLPPVAAASAAVADSKDPLRCCRCAAVQKGSV